MLQNLAVLPEIKSNKEAFQELLSWENLYMTEAPHPEVHYDLGEAYDTLTYLLKPVLVAAVLMFLTIVAVLLTGPLVHSAF